MPTTRTPALLLASALLVAVLAVSGIRPYDHATWALEVAPVFIALPVMWASYRRFPLTTLLYCFIFVHALVLILGGVYTYARVPLGFQIAELLGLHRNPYDKIGHFMQGLVPALVAREVLIRGAHVQGKKMLAFIVTCIVLAISATYELIEWGVAVAIGQDATEFLGTQGDPWDTQSDMGFALIGALVAQGLLSGWQNRQIKTLQRVESHPTSSRTAVPPLSR